MHEMLHSGALMFFLVLCTLKLHSNLSAEISRQATSLPYPIYSIEFIVGHDSMHNDYQTHSKGSKSIAVDLVIRANQLPKYLASNNGPWRQWPLSITYHIRALRDESHQYYR